MIWIFLPASIWVAACGFYDYRFRRAPNLLMLAGWLGAAGLAVGRALAGSGPAVLSWIIIISIWALALSFWLAGWWGAADAKYVMALVLAFPDPGMLVCIFLTNLVVGLLGQGRLLWESDLLAAERRLLPAIAVLSAGWLAWAGMTLAGGG
jgi:Flp pilus assembly protein protease CpaA